MSIFGKNAFGLDISDRSIEALELKRRFGKLVVYAYGRIQLERGVVENGRIIKKGAFVAALQSLLGSTHPRPLKTKNVILSIPESKTFIHVFKIPAIISSQNISEAVQFEADATIPISFEQVYHDYQILTEDKEFQDVLYIASFKEIIDGYCEAVRASGLNPVAIEPESLALARALIRKEVADATLIVDAGARTTTITVYDRHGIRYSASTKAAGDAFTAAVAKQLNIPADKATQLRKAVGFVQMPAKDEDLKVSAALQEPMKEITETITRAMSFYSKRTGIAVGRIITCGGTSLTPGFVEQLRRVLQLPVEIGNPLNEIQYEKDAQFKIKKQVLYATVVGLARRGISEKTERKDIHFLTHEKEHKKFIASKEFKKEEPVVVKEKKQLSIRGQFANKRVVVLVVVFVVLILLFITVLALSGGGEEPLIKFYSTEHITDY